MSREQMFKLAMVFLLAIPTAAFSQEREQGWGLFFNKDTFDETLFPIAMMAESGQKIGGISLIVACNKEGELIPILNEAISFDSSPRKVSFKSEKTVLDLTFSPLNVPNLGKRMAPSQSDGNKLIQLFENTATDVSYRFNDKQGKFTSIGAAKTMTILKSSCVSS